MWAIVPASIIAEINQPQGDGTVVLDTPLTGVSGYFNIRNRWTNELLVRRNGSLAAANVAADSLEAIWVIEDRTIPISDANLRGAITGVLGKPANAPVLSAEVAGIYTLWASDSNVASLSGIEHLFNLRDLRLARNPFTDVSPLAPLVNLENLNLVGSNSTNIDPLLKNEGLGAGDRVLLSRRRLGWDDRETGNIFRGQKITAVPTPGHLALQKLNMRDVVESKSLYLVDLDAADHTAHWGIEYSPGNSAFFIFAYPDGRKQYLHIGDQDLFISWTNACDTSGGRFFLHLAGTNIFRIEARAAAGENRFLQDCYKRMDIGSNEPNCEDLVVYIDEQYWLDAINSGVEGYYDPRFSEPTGSHTRIQHSKSRKFLSLDGSAVRIGTVAEADFSAQWELVEIQMARKYLFLIRNRADPSRFLHRTSSGGLGHAALPSALPDSALWVQDEANQPFVFDLDGNALDTYVLRPYLAKESALQSRDGALSFVGQLNSRTFWRFDGGVAESNLTNDIVLQEPTDGLGANWLVSFAISWMQTSSSDEKEPSKWTKFQFTGPGVYSIPVTARDVKVLISCAACGFPSEDSFANGEVVEFYEWDRPRDICLEPRGQGTNPYVSQCDPSESLLAKEAERILHENACPIGMALEHFANAFSVTGIEETGELLFQEDFERAKEALFSQGDARTPVSNFLECRYPFQSASFGVGGQAGLFGVEQSGEIGIAWNIVPDLADLDSVSYSTLTEKLNPQARFGALNFQEVFGWWTTGTDGLRGRAIGLTLNANQMKTLPARVAFAVSKVAAQLGFGANISVWMACNTGTGAVILDEQSCKIWKDSTFTGVTVDMTAGPDLSVPKIKGIGISYGETCVPAGNNRLGDCPRQ